jgi:hypothetical protein
VGKITKLSFGRQEGDYWSGSIRRSSAGSAPSGGRESYSDVILRIADDPDMLAALKTQSESECGGKVARIGGREFSAESGLS